MHRTAVIAVTVAAVAGVALGGYLVTRTDTGAAAAPSPSPSALRRTLPSAPAFWPGRGVATRPTARPSHASGSDEECLDTLFQAYVDLQVLDELSDRVADEGTIVEMFALWDVTLSRIRAFVDRYDLDCRDRYYQAGCLSYQRWVVTSQYRALDAADTIYALMLDAVRYFDLDVEGLARAMIEYQLRMDQLDEAWDALHGCTAEET